MTQENQKTPSKPADKALSDPAGSVGCLWVFSSMLEVTTDAAHFYGDDLVKLKASIKAALEDCNRFYWLMDNVYLSDSPRDLMASRETIDAAIHSQNTD